MKANLFKSKTKTGASDARKSAGKERKDTKTETRPAAGDFETEYGEEYFSEPYGAERGAEKGLSTVNPSPSEVSFGENADAAHRADPPKSPEREKAYDSEFRDRSESEDESAEIRNSREKISEAERKKRIRELKRAIRLLDAELKIIDFGGDPEKANLKEFIAEFID